MKGILRISIVALMTFLYSSCDEVYQIEFRIFNQTDENVEIAYLSQKQDFTSIMYTPGEEQNYHRIVFDGAAVEKIKPHDVKAFIYDIGMERPCIDPEYNGIVPLWDRIVYIIIGNDTLDRSKYEKIRWIRTPELHSLILTKD